MQGTEIVIWVVEVLVFSKGVQIRNDVVWWIIMDHRFTSLSLLTAPLSESNGKQSQHVGRRNFQQQGEVLQAGCRRRRLHRPAGEDWTYMCVFLCDYQTFFVNACNQIRGNPPEWFPGKVPNRCVIIGEETWKDVGVCSRVYLYLICIDFGMSLFHVWTASLRTHWPWWSYTNRTAECCALSNNLTLCTVQEKSSKGPVQGHRPGDFPVPDRLRIDNLRGPSSVRIHNSWGEFGLVIQ